MSSLITPRNLKTIRISSKLRVIKAIKIWLMISNHLTIRSTVTVNICTRLNVIDTRLKSWAVEQTNLMIREVMEHHKRMPHPTLWDWTYWRKSNSYVKTKKFSKNFNFFSMRKLSIWIKWRSNNLKATAIENFKWMMRGMWIRLDVTKGMTGTIFSKGCLQSIYAVFTIDSTHMPGIKCRWSSSSRKQSTNSFKHSKYQSRRARKLAIACTWKASSVRGDMLLIYSPGKWKISQRGKSVKWQWNHIKWLRISL